jgi:hypothetical protein
MRRLVRVLAVATVLTPLMSHALAGLRGGSLASGPTAPLVPSYGRPRAECRLEWEVVFPLVESPFVRCVDGDPTCDADRTRDGTCIFRVAPCFGVPAPRAPRCRPGRTSIFALRVRTARVHGPLERANAEAILANVVALGGRRTRRGGAVRFRPALAPGVCAALTEIKVPAGPPPHGGLPTFLRGAVKGKGGADKDKLGLFCLPIPNAE